MEYNKWLNVFVLVMVYSVNFTNASSNSTSANPVKFYDSVTSSSVVYHTRARADTDGGPNKEIRLQTQESRPQGRRHSYSYGATQRPVSYDESYNSPPYYYESNNPPQSYHREYHSPPSSYNVDYNERPRSYHRSYQSPPQRSQHRSSYNNQDSNEHHDRDQRSYGSDNDDYGGGYGGGDSDSNNYQGDDNDDYGHSPSGGEGQDYGRFNLEY